MHQIAALIAGIRGADNGTASIYRRGTSTPVTCYVDFEGTSTFNGGSVPLDAYGSAIVFVNEVVRVVARNASGATVREWVAGDAATAVELRSLSATGAAYSGGALAPGNPTTVKAWADSWLTSAGAPDFQVFMNGAAVDLQTALSGVAGLRYYVVTDDAYGASGDGVTNDVGAVQAAINAANAAGGGIVFFPPGTFLINGTLTSYASVSFLGYSNALSVVKVQSASASLMTGAAPASISNLLITMAGVYSGQLLSFTGPANGFMQMSGLIMEGTGGSFFGNFQGTLLNVTGLFTASIRDCYLGVGLNGALTTGVDLSVDIRGCSFICNDSIGVAAASLISARDVFMDSVDVTFSGAGGGLRKMVDAFSVDSSGLKVDVTGGYTLIVFFTADINAELYERGTMVREVVGVTNVVMYSGFPTSAAATALFSGVQLGSRVHRTNYANANADPVTITADQARHVVARVTSTAGWTGNCDVNVNMAVPGDDLIVSFWNDTGAPVTFVWGANVSIAAATTFAVAANSFRTFHMVCSSDYPTSSVREWFLVSSTAGAEVVE